VSGSKRCRRTSTGGVGVDGEQEEGEEVTLEKLISCKNQLFIIIIILQSPPPLVFLESYFSLSEIQR